MRRPLPPVAAVIGFIDGINRGDVDHLASLMSEDHRLQVFDERPLDGRAENVEAWRGYVSSFPNYLIYPHQLVDNGDEVVVVGHTTGSHLVMPDDEESRLTVLWRAIVENGRLTLWQLLEDTPERRQHYGIAQRHTDP